jgi:hypothetical protein
VEYKKVDDSAWASDTVANNPAHGIYNVEDSTIYMIRIKTVCNDDTESVYSDILAVTTFSSPVLTCPQPTNFVITPDYYGAEMSWQSQGGETEWLITWNSEDTDDETETVSSATYTFTDWTPGTTYTVTVVALCENGAESVPSIMTITTLSTPTSYRILATSTGNGTIFPSGEITVPAGADTTFIFSPSTGHAVSVVLVDSDPVSERESYTFRNVSANHTIAVDFATSISQYSINEIVSVYPNPTTGELKIKNGELKIKGVAVFDIYGKNLHSVTGLLVTPNSSTFSIDIFHLPAGIYFLRIETEQGVAVKKVVKN